MSEGDSGQQVIIPRLRWHNLTPEGVILSHEHLIIGAGCVRYSRSGRQCGIRSLPGAGRTFALFSRRAAAMQANCSGALAVSAKVPTEEITAPSVWSK